MNLPKVLPKYTEAETSKKGFLNQEDLKRLGINLLKFVAPTGVVFFGLLSQGVPLEKAWPVAALALYQALADYLGKLNNSGK